jgi:hypothetical protein
MKYNKKYQISSVISIKRYSYSYVFDFFLTDYDTVRLLSLRIPFIIFAYRLILINVSWIKEKGLVDNGLF